jgi:hypothetical protein
MILGIPKRPAEGRRINIAIVNVGNIPATFRIRAIGPNGATMGVPIESGVDEDGLWVTQNLETELHASIDEGAMIRVSVIAGTGVAYASVVQPNGDVLNITAVPAQAR